MSQTTPQVTSVVQNVLFLPQKGLTYMYSLGSGHAVVLKVKDKGKAVPLQAWSGPEGSRKLTFPHFMTTAQNGGKVVSLTHRPPLPP
jgi:hypothetical protein